MTPEPPILAAESNHARSNSGLFEAAWIIWALLAAAIIFRLVRYLANPAVWLDESMLIDNILWKPLPALLNPLDNHQAAPFGFLLAEQCITRLFGIGEYALRLIPMLSSLAAVFLFYALAAAYLPRRAQVVALALFAISSPLIRYTAEVKQYALDLTATLLILLAALLVASCAPRRPSPGDPPQPGWLQTIHAWFSPPGMPPSAGAPFSLTFLAHLLLALTGAAAVWCSFPSVFVLFAAGLALTIGALRRREWPRAIALLPVGAAWLGSFFIYYTISLRTVAASDTLESWWAHAFLSVPPRSISDLNWVPRTFFEMLDYFTGPSAVGIAALTFIIGTVSLFGRHRERAVLLLAPLLLALLASALHRYPFTERFLLFAAPILIITIAQGVETIRRTTRWPLLTGLIAGLLLFHPLTTEARALIRPQANQGVRPTVEYLARYMQPGDDIYVYYWAHYPFRYYAQRYGIDLTHYTAGITARNDWRYYERDLDDLRGKPRVWLLFCDIEDRLGGGEQKFFEARLNDLGLLLDKYQPQESTLLLYDLSQPERKSLYDDP